MFPISDPGTTLDLHRQRVAEMIRQADDYKRARALAQGRHRRFGRWRRSEPRERGGKVTTATA